MRLVRTTRFSRRNLPHWEVEGGRYFVTVRCADSLPAAAILRLAEVGHDLRHIEPRSVEFAVMQRRMFATLDRYLDAGYGKCPLRDAAAARIVLDELETLSAIAVTAPHYSIMPNHWHALLVPTCATGPSLSTILKRVKGRSARLIRQISGGHGPLWQREWFDRWIRDDAEWTKCVAYIRNNPVKAGLVRHWCEHPWTR